MPRSRLCRNDADIAADKLRRWIRGSGKQKELAALLKISEQLFSYRLNHMLFTAPELIRIFKARGMTPEELTFYFLN